MSGENAQESQAAQARRNLGLMTASASLPGMRTTMNSAVPFITSKHKPQVPLKHMEEEAFEAPESPKPVGLPKGNLQSRRPADLQMPPPVACQHVSSNTPLPTIPASPQTPQPAPYMSMSPLPRSPQASPSSPVSLPTTPSTKVAPRLPAVLMGLVEVRRSMAGLTTHEKQRVAEQCRAAITNPDTQPTDTVGPPDPQWRRAVVQVVVGGGGLEVLHEGHQVLSHRQSDVSVVFLPCDAASSVVYVARCRQRGRVGVLLSFPTPATADAVVQAFAK